METLKGLLVAIVLLLATATISGTYLAGLLGGLWRGFVVRLIRGVLGVALRAIVTAFRLLVPRRPRHVRPLPSARTLQRQTRRKHDGQLR
jgi:hypothetical protein